MTDEKLNQILKQALVPEIGDSEIKLKRAEQGEGEFYMSEAADYRNAQESGKHSGKHRANLREKLSRNVLSRKGISAAAIAMAVLLAGGGSVYAAVSHFGLLDFTGNLREEIPQDAATLIEHNVEQSVSDATEDTPIQCSVKEALRDSETIMLVYEVAAKEHGKYLFIPEDAVPEDNMSDWSDIKGITAAEYARQHDLTIFHIGGGIMNTEELGIAESALSFHSAEDDVMEIYVRSHMQSDAKSMEVKCVATAWLGGTNDVYRREMSFALEDKSKARRSSYQQESIQLADVSREVSVSEAEVLQTELGTYIDVTYDGEEEVIENVVFRVKDANGRALEQISGTGVEVQENGSVRQRLILNKTELGESFVLEIYDYVEGTVCGTIRMRRV